ncbi:MAG TPA: glucoamylase family protein [Verrucomicrobiae bacterium]|nr:glucoamylase family protein [Verrucomicrobiae bacterium]
MLLLVTLASGASAQITNLTVIPGDRAVALLWDTVTRGEKEQFRVERGVNPAGPFTQLQAVNPRRNFTDFNLTNGQVACYRVVSLKPDGSTLAMSEPVLARPRAFANDAEFLETLQHTAFEYFWREANPENGLVRDRSEPNSPSSIAAVGFGLTAIPIGVEHGWITRDQGCERALRTARTFWETPQGANIAGNAGVKGWYYHFLNLDTADRAWQCELSSIDTALLLAGVLSAREFFDGATPGEIELRRLANQLVHRVDWRWMANGEDSLTMGWKPESGFHKMRWIGYNEAMILYVLALGAGENPLPPAAWGKWTSGYEWSTHHGQSYIGFQPLFGHQYSACWIDFRNVADRYTREKGITYFENSRRATLAQIGYAIANPSKFTGYSSNVWGITACDGPGIKGYHGYAGRGLALFDDGTIAPTAAGGSMVFTPAESLGALRYFYDQFRLKLWCAYGPRDAFNLTADWWADDVLGIDQGPILLMAENYRTGAVWKRFMRCPEIQEGLKRAGFEPLAAAK